MGTVGSPYDPLPSEGTYNSYYVKRGFGETYGFSVASLTASAPYNRVHLYLGISSRQSGTSG